MLTTPAAVQRFYFVSDPTLLEILSLGSDPPSVVPHFQSGLFDSLTAVTFDKVDKGKMLEMFSQQGEKVEFEKPVEAKGEIQCVYNVSFAVQRVLSCYIPSRSYFCLSLMQARRSRCVLIAS